MGAHIGLPQSLRPLIRTARAKLLSIGLPRASNIAQPPAEVLASEKLSIVVPIHDSPEVTARCLRSLKRYGGRAQVALVDDASKDPATFSLLDDIRKTTDWAVIRHSASAGHSRACEAGTQIADRPYLCLLNSDTVITPWSWGGPVDALESCHEIAVAGPSTSQTATVQALFRAHYCRHYWSDEQINAYAMQHLARIPPRSWLDIPTAGGFAFFIRRSIWEQMRGFDPNLPDYGNETELCVRLRARGLRVVWARNSYIHHLGSQSYGRVARDDPRRRSIAARAYIDAKYAAPS